MFLQTIVFMFFLSALFAVPTFADNLAKKVSQNKDKSNFGKKNWNMDYDAFLNMISDFSNKDFDKAIQDRKNILYRMEKARLDEEDRVAGNY